MSFITQNNVNNPSINYGNLIDPLNTKPSQFDDKTSPYKFSEKDKYEHRVSEIDAHKSTYGTKDTSDTSKSKLEKIYNEKAIQNNLGDIRKVKLEDLPTGLAIGQVEQYNPNPDKVESPFELIKEGKFDELKKLTSKFGTLSSNKLSEPGEKNNEPRDDIEILQSVVSKYFDGNVEPPIEVNKDVTITRDKYDSPFEVSNFNSEEKISLTQISANDIDSTEYSPLDNNIEEQSQSVTLGDFNTEDILELKFGNSQYDELDETFTGENLTLIHETSQGVDVPDNYEPGIDNNRSTLRSSLENNEKFTFNPDVTKEQIESIPNLIDILDIPLSNENINKVLSSLDEIQNRSEISGRHTKSDIELILAKDVNKIITEELNSILDFDDIQSSIFMGRPFQTFFVKSGIKDIDSRLDVNQSPQAIQVFGKDFTPFMLQNDSAVTFFNSIFDEDNYNVGVNNLSDNFASGFTPNQLTTDFNFSNKSVFTVGDIVSPVDFFRNVNRPGFDVNSPFLQTLYEVDSSDLSLSSRGIGFDVVHYLSNNFNSGFTSFVPPLTTEFINESSQFGFTSTNIPSVDYIANLFNSGFTLNPRPLTTEFINESSDLDFNGPTPEGVDFFFNNWNTGFTIQAIPLLSEYKYESSELDLGSFGFATDFFYNFWNEGFTLNAIPLVSEYKYESSLLDLGSFGDAVDYFLNTNGTGFTLNPQALVTEYVLNSSIFDFDGEIPDSGVNYLDISKSYSREGFIQRMNNVTDYINESSLYGFEGEVGPSVDYISNDYNSGFTTEIELLSSEYKNNTSNLSFEVPIGVDYFNHPTDGFVINMNDSLLEGDSTYDNIETHDDNNLSLYGDKESEFSTEARALRFQRNDALRFEGLNYKAVNFIDDIVRTDLTQIPIEIAQNEFNLQPTERQTNFTLGGSPIENGILQTVDQDYFYKRHQLESDYSNLGESLEDWENNNGIKGTYLRSDERGIQPLDMLYDKITLPEAAYGDTQPFIVRGISGKQGKSKNVNWMDEVVEANPYITGGDDIIRGGIVTQNVRTLYDTKRIGDFLQTPTGLRFLVNQQIMQSSNPTVETAPSDGADTGIGVLDTIIDIGQDILIGDRPTQRFNPLSIIAQVKSGMDGAKATRHGVGDPYSDQGTYGEVTKERNELTNSLFNGSTGIKLDSITPSTSVGDQGKHNRLLMLAAELFPGHMTDASFPSPSGGGGDSGGGDGFFEGLLDVGLDALTALGKGILNSINLPLQLGGYAEMLFGGYEGQTINKLSQANGGPHSRMGIGPTLIHRTTDSFAFNVENVNQLNFANKQYASFQNKNNYWRGKLVKNDDQSGIFDIDAFDNTHKKVAFELLIKDSTILPDVDYLQYEDPVSIAKLETGKLFNIFRRYAGFDVAPNLTLIDTGKDVKMQIANSRYTFDYLSGTVQPILNPLESNRIQTLIENYSENEDEYNVNPHNNPEEDRNTHVNPKSLNGLGSYLTLAYPQLNKIQDKLRTERGRGYINNFSEQLTEDEATVEQMELRVNNEVRLTPDQKLWKTITTDHEISDYEGLSRDVKFGEGTQGRLYGKEGGLIDRSNPIDIELPNTGNSKITDVSEWKKIQKMSRGDKINLINVIKKGHGYKSDEEMYGKATDTQGGDEVRDFVRFYFSTIDYYPGAESEGIILPFRATFDGGITDSFSPSWNTQMIMGRGDSAAMYNGFSRTVGFSFTIHPSSREEMWSNWRKLNALTSWTAPDFGDSGDSPMKGPVIRLTMGDLYVNMPCYIDSLSVTLGSEGGWDLANLKDDLNMGTLQLPHSIKVQISLVVIGNHRPQKSGYMYELRSRGRSKNISWLDETEMSY